MEAAGQDSDERQLHYLPAQQEHQRVYTKDSGLKPRECSDELTAGAQKSVLVEEGAQVAKTFASSDSSSSPDEAKHEGRVVATEEQTIESMWQQRQCYNL